MRKLSIGLIFLSAIVVILIGKNVLKPSQISHISYGKTKECIIYLKENSEYVPYIVLTDDYQNNTLLLRKELIFEAMQFDDNSGYYPDSNIDNFLNHAFINRFSEEVKNAVTTVNIEVASKDSLGNCGDTMKNIYRKVFLLSCAETGLSNNSMLHEKGKTLKYFLDPNNRIACKQSKPSSWWLRSSYSWYTNAAWGINPEGDFGAGDVSAKNGVRPAMCILSKTKIEKHDDKGVYILSIDK